MSARAFYRRQFLNTEEHGGTAWVEARVGEASAAHNDKYDTVDASLSFADCNRIINLDFDVYTNDKEANARQKIAKLRRVVNAFCDALISQLDNRRDDRE
jgi:hypothetical protein